MGAAEVILAVFAGKDIGKAKPVTPDHIGLVLPNRFAAGYGMDAYGYWRNLSGIRAIRTCVFFLRGRDGELSER
jgi:hypoxanthine phosphoribosyltransferase